MRVVVDVSPLSHPRTGIGNYIRGTLDGLSRAAGDEHEIVAFAPASRRGRRLIEASLAGIPVERRIAVLPLAHLWRTAWSRLGRPSAERFLGRFDVLHFWDWMYPPQRSGVRATMIHDLVPLRFPGWVHPRTRRMHAAKYANSARTCDLVFVNSRFTGVEVVELLGVERDRVRVAVPGVADCFRPDGPRADLGRPYILTTASFDDRKNLRTLLKAHPLVADGLELVVAGENAPPGAASARFLGYMPEEELARLYRGAAVFVYPSRFEGFGIPVVEAMASGVPCVASSHPSLDEACGDAALRADPESPEEMAHAIDHALEKRDELVERGLRHASRFRWEDTGRVFLASYADAL